LGIIVNAGMDRICLELVIETLSGFFSSQGILSSGVGITVKSKYWCIDDLIASSIFVFDR